MPSRKLLILGSVIVLAIVALAVIFAVFRPAEISDNGKVKVVASFYPLAEFASRAGGDRVDVQNVVPAGVESHDFEPTPSHIVSIQRAQLFIYNGSGFDVWAERIAADLDGQEVRSINMGEKLKRLPLAPGSEEDEREAEGDAFDPHYWLDPVMAQQEVTAIRDSLSDVGPTDAELFKANADKYIDELKELDRKYEAGLRSCEKRTIVTTHDAFRYLASRYKIEVVPIAGISPEQEPSPRKLAEISTLVRKEGIGYIFSETLASPKFAKAIADETGAKVLVFNPVEGLTEKEAEQGKNYVSIMEQNLKNLQLALGCK